MAKEESLRDYLKWVTADLAKTRRRLREAEAASHEPIAIVGMACRFPGGVASPEDLWQLLLDGRDAIGDFPTDRGWNLAALYHPDADQPGTAYTRHGGFLDCAAEFDPELFGISPREALAMDPQQRLLLETTWEVFERTGLDPTAMRASRTGVFVGSNQLDYIWSIQDAPEDIEGYLGTGNTASVLSGRISYTFGLEGPAVTIDTACSSSLVALHLAVQALRNGECSMALAGGATVMASPTGFVEFSRQRGLAADGRCKAFSADADGMGMSEGAAMLLVERLSDARRNGRRVLAVIRGTAVNQDGASNGLTAPNGPSQQRVIEAALANARLSTADIDVIEAHGTGTTLGDPIEAQALIATYGQGRAADRPLRIGSVKSNLGHTQAAAGAAGVMKAVLALQHGVLPATLHADTASPHVNWSAGAVSLLTRQADWARGEQPRRAGVSSFGISGTNAHVIIEEAPEEGEAEAAESDAGADTAEARSEAEPGHASTTGEPESAMPVALLTSSAPWVISGRTSAALTAQAERLAAWVKSELSTPDVAWSLATSRAALEHRAVAVGADPLTALRSFVDGEPSAQIVHGSVIGRSDAVFVFPGQGSQWVGMAVGLLDSSPAFAASIADCEAALSKHVDWSLTEVLRSAPGAPGLDRVDVVQSVLWAVMVSLAGLWRALGVEPAAVVGHSQGEIAAAYVAGALSLEDSARIVALRSKAILALSGRGGMVSIPLPVAEVEARLASYVGRISVAALNGPASTVVSGDTDALDELLAECEAAEIRARRIDVDYASHSAHVEAIETELADVLADIRPRTSSIPFYSTLPGGLLDTSALDASYWYRNLRERVQFEPAIKNLLADGYGIFIETSAHPVLTVGITESIEQASAHAIALGTLRRDEDGPDRILLSAAEAWTHGATVDWRTVISADVTPIDLPTYAFQHKRYWLGGGAARGGDPAAWGLSGLSHPLLGVVTRLAEGDECVISGRLSADSHSWLTDHMVTGRVLVAGTVFVELAVRAGDEVGCSVLEELTLEAPLVLGHDAVALQVRVGAADAAGRRDIGIYSRTDGAGDQNAWVRHAGGTLVESPAASDGWSDVREWPPPGAEAVDIEGFYPALLEAGYGYGPAFQGLRAAWRRGDEVFAEVELPEPVRADAAGFGLHPALLDCALHAIAASDMTRAFESLRLPFSWTGVTLFATGASALRVRITPAGPDAVSIALADPTGEPVAFAQSFTSRPIPAGHLDAPHAEHDDLFRIDWATVQSAAEQPDTTRWVVLGHDPADLAPALGSTAYPDTATLAAAVEAGAAVPELVIAQLSPASRTGRDAVDLARPEEVHAATVAALELVQAWLADERWSASRLAIVTRGAVATRPGEDVDDLVHSGIWGLIRSAQSENPGRFLLADLDPHLDATTPETFRSALMNALATAVAGDEPQVVVRDNAVLAPRLARSSDNVLTAPDDVVAWRLDTSSPGTLDNLSLLPCPEASVPLAPGQLRVSVRAAGLNFKDLLGALGMYPGEVTLGTEGAGIVTEVASDVRGFAVGDRVMGMMPGSFGPLCVTDARVIGRIPAGWSFERAAAVPVVYATAYYALVDLARLRAGESVLIHAAAGGVGMAAVQLARYFGAEVYVTASPGKWGALRALGVPGERISSSRDLGFEQRVLEATGGRGVDVVLDSLAGDFVDASLRLLPRGGRFIEMGKTDIRDAEQVDLEFPGVEYRAFDLVEAGPERVGEILAEVVGLFERGVLTPHPLRTWDVRRAPEAFRFMSQAKHVGKLVLTMPAPVNPNGTALIVGGTGTLGGLLAKHLVTTHGIRHLLLTSRSGAQAPGADDLHEQLTALGAQVMIEACDAANRDALATILAKIPAQHPLTAVVHAAGVLDDGILPTLNPQRLTRVLHPKVNAAINLHELTTDADLAMFALFSSGAGVLGGASQGNYAAANAFLDALAAHRRSRGLPATSLAWGYWAETSGMTAHLSEDDLARMRRSGVLPFSVEDGLALFDAATVLDQALLLPMRLDLAALRAKARGADVPSLLRGLIRPAARRAAAAGDQTGSTLVRRLADRDESAQEELLLDLVRAHAATVLGHAAAYSVEPGRAFKELGFDSLTAVELRNRLADATGVRLPATLVFDYPNPLVLARHLRAELLTASVAQKPASAPTRVRNTWRADEPIAIVGMACRYPGGVESPEDLWQLVAEGRDAIGDLPTDRGWDLAALYDPDGARPGTTYTRAGGFIDGADLFDADMFGISPREALAMDPQQRLLLEVSWEALERAGLDPGVLRGSRTGVYAGAVASGYGGNWDDAPSDVGGYLGVGTSGSVISGRISYTFGFEGPAVTVDTACSSSLVALHLACQALRAGECDMALAGGVAVMVTPGLFVDFARQRGLAVDGRCKAFSSEADGFGPAEGAAMLLVERLSDAVRLGHRVLGVVRGSAVNQDGASNGLTAPNGPSQERVIRAALTAAGLRAQDVDAVEAHGTGTSLGDPIEAQALLATYGQGRDAGRPLWLGSVKSNIGHTQAAAGIAGVIKMVMALEHSTLPRTLHADTPSQHIDWTQGTIALLHHEEPWPHQVDRPRRAGISSFGIGGTNAHVIVEQAPPQPTVQKAAHAPSLVPVPWVLSARSGEGLRALAGRLAGWASARDAVDARDVGWSLATRRAVLEHRAVVWGRDTAELVSGLSALAQGSGPVPGPGSGVRGRVKCAVLFTGQGAQTWGMGRDLYAAYPVFASALDEVCAVFDGAVPYSVRDVVLGEGEPIDAEDTAVGQPALFAYEVALFRLWRSWGAGVDFVGGHSLGGITAAFVAGVFSLPDAARLVAARGRLMGSLPPGGAMLAVGAPETEIAGLLDDGVEIASVNSPNAVVVSGPRERVEVVAELCAQRGWRTSWLKVSHAFHSALMEPMLEQFAALLSGMQFHAPSIPLVSDSTGELAGTEVCDPQYWVQHARRTMRFADTINTLRDSGVRVFVELGPDSILTPMTAECLTTTEPADVVAISTQRRGHNQINTLTHALGQAYTHGVPVDWTQLLHDGHAIDLPTYPFQHQHYWLDSTNQRRRSNTDHTEDVDDRFWDAIEHEDVQSLADALDLGDQRQETALRDVLPALSSWRRRRREHSTTDRWRYRVVWKPVQDTAIPASGRVPAPGPGTWLLVVPDAEANVDSGAAAGANDLAEACARQFTADGARVVTVTAGPAQERDELAAQLAAEISTLTSEIVLTGVLSLLALDERAHPAHPHVPAGLAATLTLVQALGDAEVSAPLWCVTTAAVSIGAADPAPDPVQAQIWGLGRVIALEHPDRWGGLIDLPATALHGERVLARLRAVLTGTIGATSTAAANPAPEDQIAIRETGTFARRLLRAPLPTEAPPSGSGWTPRGTVLVTGGTGGLGSEVARWLAASGADHLMLASRRGPDAPGADELTAELTALGAQVTVAACDATDALALAALAERMDAAGTPIRAVIHAAGLGQSTPLAETSIAELSTVVEAKVAGAGHLDRLFPGDALDAFVLFSSIAGVWGSGGGQGAYAAANARLDALAAARRARGAVATSIAWGPWAGAGMAAEAGAREQLARRGLAAMSPKLAVAALARALAHNETCVTIADVTWDRFLPAFAAARPRPLFADLAEARELETAARRAPAPAESAVVRRLAGLSAADRYRTVLDLVRGQVSGVLGHGAAERVDADRAFKDLGFDSLTAVELRDRLTAETGVPLPATLVFDYPTPGALARQLTAELSGDGDGDVAAESLSAIDAGTGADLHADATGDAIAIVGMACRYPGGVASPEDLWQLVTEGRDAIGGFPTDRGWDLDSLFDPDPDHAGTSYTREGGFLYDAADFDPAHFGISPREALAMDPQQRLLLETAWESLERGGLDPAALKGTAVGVFIGAGNSGYLGTAARLPEDIEGYALTGTVASVLSGRVAYTFGFEGPAVTVDTACSSSLVALHLAAQALRAGECTMALAGGVSIMATPTGFVEFSRQRGLSRDGRCRSFAASADGTGWSEGVGVLLLERLSEARRRGHRVLAVVRGSAINQDGASNGLTAPNGPSQRRVIRAALANARLTPDQVDVVEAHGTGTTLGDPIEAQALLATYGRERSAGQPLWLGSIKSNIGHSAAAAGVAGVIKMVMALRNGTLPRTLHVDEPTHEVDWSTGAVALLREPVDWPDTGRPRRAAVSAFGVSGTNAHVILESPQSSDSATAGEPPAIAPASPVVPELPVAPPSPLPLLLSASSEPALRGQAARLRDFLSADAALAPADLAHSLASHRTTLDHRAVLLATDRQAALASLDALANAETADDTNTTDAVSRGTAITDRRVVFVFPGQGSQWTGMAAALLADSPFFAARIAECEAALAPHVDWSLTDVLRDAPGAASLDRVDVVQPALWAVMVSLAALWRACGVEPDAVIGHSQGEIAAAVVAGALSLEDAAAVVALRSRAILALCGAGGMVSVQMPEADIAARIAPLGDRVSIAAVNGPAAVVVSGRPDALDELLARCEADEVRARRIPVDYASHSAQVEQIRAQILSALASIAPRSADVPFYSTVVGKPIDTATLDAEYWYTNLRQPVRFGETVTTLMSSGFEIFVEVSAHPVLTVAVEETGEALAETAAGPEIAAEVASGVPTAPGSITVLPSLRRGEGGWGRFLRSLAEAYVRGVAVDWRRVLVGSGGRAVDLPTYAFHRQRYWIAPDTGAGDPAALGLEAADHPLLGAAVPVAGTGGCVLTGRISARTQPWLADHVVAGLPLLPAAALVELAVRAGDEVGCGRLEDLTLEAPLAVPEHRAARVQVTLSGPDPDGRRDVAVYSRPDAEPAAPWTRHATGVLAAARPEPPAGLAVWPPEGAEAVPLDDFYPALAAAGYHYGPAFQALHAVWRHGADVYAEVALPAEQRRDAGRYVLHPVLLDAAAQAAWFATAEPSGDDAGDGALTAPTPAIAVAEPRGGDLRLPFAWSDVAVHAAGATRLRVRITPAGPGARALLLADAAGEPVATIDVLASRPASAEQLEQALKLRGDATTYVTLAAKRRTADSGAASADAAVALRARLAGRTDAERDRVLLEAVRTHVAAVLGHEDAAAIAGDLAFKSLGFDSLTAVELRNRLGAATGLRLPATLVFSHPNPAALARHLRARLAAESVAVDADSAGRELDRLEAALATAPGQTRAEITRRLEAMLRAWRPLDGADTAGPDGAAAAVLHADALESVSAEELFDLIDKQLGES